jgi:hypothetical protein
MNAFNQINLAGACILTSTDYARELGIPENRWIYPLGGAGTDDSHYCKPSTPAVMGKFVTDSRCSLGTSQFLLESIYLKIVGRRFGGVGLDET